MTNTKKTSWVAVNRQTGKAIGEFYSLALIGNINQEKYEVVSIMDWLVRVNRQAKAA